METFASFNPTQRIFPLAWRPVGGKQAAEAMRKRREERAPSQRIGQYLRVLWADIPIRHRNGSKP